MQTNVVTLDSTSQQYDDIWKTVNCADYTTAVIKLDGIWDGPVTFWGDNEQVNSVELAVQDISNTNWTTAAISEAGSSPSVERRVFRVPVAGLTRIGFYGDIYNSPPNLFSGSVTITVTLVSDTNAR